jgi:hypothetical protein
VNQVVTRMKTRVVALLGIGLVLAAGGRIEGREPGLLDARHSAPGILPLADAVHPARCVPYLTTSSCFAPLRLVRSLSFVEAPMTAGAGPGTIVLAWDAPTESSDPTSYIIEAGTEPGRANVTVFDTRSSDTTLSVVGVPPGLYYVRVRARNAGGVSDPSNEIAVTVGTIPRVGMDTCATPIPPTAVSSTVTDGQVTLSWIGSPGAISYQVEAGASPGASDLFNGDAGGPTSLQARVAPGVYFVRVRAKSSCGMSPPSNEVMIRVTR